jgi:hypothetical protein
VVVVTREVDGGAPVVVVDEVGDPDPGLGAPVVVVDVPVPDVDVGAPVVVVGVRTPCGWRGRDSVVVTSDEELDTGAVELVASDDEVEDDPDPGLVVVGASEDELEELDPGTVVVASDDEVEDDLDPGLVVVVASDELDPGPVVVVACELVVPSELVVACELVVPSELVVACELVVPSELVVACELVVVVVGGADAAAAVATIDETTGGDQASAVPAAAAPTRSPRRLNKTPFPAGCGGSSFCSTGAQLVARVFSFMPADTSLWLTQLAHEYRNASGWCTHDAGTSGARCIRTNWRRIAPHAKRRRSACISMGAGAAATESARCGAGRHRDRRVRVRAVCPLRHACSCGTCPGAARPIPLPVADPSATPASARHPRA